MNALHLSTSVSPARTLHSRAQFSPLSRRNSGAATSAATPRVPFRVAPTPVFPPLWPAALLARLQPIVTRYRD